MRLPDFWWMRTVGAPTEGDPRDGELHQVWSTELPAHSDLESWDAEQYGEWDESEPYDPAIAGDARYWRNPAEPPGVHDDGRPVWTYHFVPYGEEPHWD